MEEAEKYLNGLMNNDRKIVTVIYDSYFLKVSIPTDMPKK